MDDMNRETVKDQPQADSSKTGAFLPRFFRWVLVVLAVWFVVADLHRALLIAGILIGLGLVIFIHELGHFVACKLVGVKVEAFSIGFPPYLLAFQKRGEKKFFRFLKNTGEANAEEPEGEQWGTVYKIGLIPCGGFVKPLGQADKGAEEITDDPRSFANKPLWAKVTILVAGVTFNAISAMLIFMGVFLAGLELNPPIVGGVVPGSPAQAAGLKAGDRVVEVNGEKFVDFTSLQFAAALSEKGEASELRIRRPDGTLKDVSIVAERLEGSDFKTFGIEMPFSLTIPEYQEQAESVFEGLGFEPGDHITHVNGKPVETSWEFEQSVRQSEKPEVMIQTVGKDGQTRKVAFPVRLEQAQVDFYGSRTLSHIYSMVPRLRVDFVQQTATDTPQGPLLKKAREMFGAEPQAQQEAIALEAGDIILKAGQQEFPTFTQLREITIAHENKALPMTVLRGEQEVEIEVYPQRKGEGKDNVYIGVMTSLDWEHTVVAATVDIENGPKALEIPSGARVTRVDGREAATFYDVIRLIRENMGQRISLDYRLDAEQAGSVSIDIPATHDYITAYSTLAKNLPLNPVYEVYKAKSPLDAVGIGFKRAVKQLTGTYLTIKRIITRDVNPRGISGPVGILTMSYSMLDYSLMYYLYFMGFISAAVAGFNLLPLPILDGGVVVLSIIEEIKGGPLSVRAQTVINYFGLVIILTLFVLITLNDILRFFNG